MRRLAFVICAIASSVIGTYAQRGLPRFAQFPATVERAKAKSIDFKRNPEARTFRTRLTAALRRGVNFSGRYVVTVWGCGTGCLSGAIIDARTGDVHWPEQLNALSVWYEDVYDGDPIEHKRNSRLLIIHGSPGRKDDNTTERPVGIYFYEWKNSRLRQLRYVPLHKD